MKLTLRALLKSPGFTAIALVTLALGIGVNTAMFSVVSAFLLQPAPYPNADRLIRVFRTSPQSKTWPHSAPDIDDTRVQSHAFESIAAFQWWSFSMSQPGQPAERLNGVVASADLFRTLGMQPVLGRAFTAEEQVVGRDQVMVITDAMWRSRFGADPSIIGRVVRVDGANLTVIGVMPPEFAYPLFWGKLEAIRPLVFAADWQHERGTHWLGALARLKPGMSLAQAQAEADTISSRLAKQYPDTNGGNGLRLVPLHESTMNDTGRTVSWLLLGLSGFVLLIACVNLANLQLARSAARARDYAVRAALGASQGRLIRHQLAESFVLAALGGTAGVLLALWLNEFLARRLDIADGAVTSIPLDWKVLTFAIVAALAAGLLSGITPALLTARANVNTAIKSQSRGSTGDRSRHRLRQGLIITEIAVALVLLAGAGFYIRGLQRIAVRDPGWRTSGLLIGTMTLPNTLPTDRYVKDAARRTFYDRAVQRLQMLPGVEHVSLSSALPIDNFHSSRDFAIEGRPDALPGQAPLADMVMVSPDFFDTIGLQLVQGHFWSENIRHDSPAVAIINETMARQFWPNENPIGKRIGSTDPKQRNWMEVVGVVRDVGFVASLGIPDTRLQVYRPLVQEPWGYLSVAVRAKSPETLAEPLRRAIAEIDPDLPVSWVQTVHQAVENAQHNFKVANQLLAGFAVLGLVLAAVGLYGVISTLVVQRTQEFGIRFALGAQSRDVLWLVLGKSIGLTALGSAIGLVGAGLLLAFLGKMMPGLPGNDPLVLTGIVAVLFLVALGACFLPARRAAKVDPIIALRAE
jgi:predicted permease